LNFNDKKIDTPAVVFAGGKSSRMGRDKALLPFGGYPTLVEYQYRRLEKIFDEVYISWKSEKAEFGAKSIFDIDEYADISAPTVGLLSIMKSIESEYVFIISVDTPLFGEDEIRRLFQNFNREYEIITVGAKYGVEPLISIYSTKLYNRVQEMVKSGNHKLKDLLKSSKTLQVDFQESRPFTNLNYWEEYQKAKEEYR